MMKKQTDHKKDQYWIGGRHSVLSAIANPKRTCFKLICLPKYKDLLKNFSIKADLLDQEAINKVSAIQFHNQGIAGLFSALSEDLENEILTKQRALVIILDQVTDPQNIGAILRSAASFCADAVIVPCDNTPDESHTIAKASSGGLEVVPYVRVTNLSSTIQLLQKNGFWVYGLDGKATTLLDEVTFSDKVALVLGSEDDGMRRLVRENCDHLIKIKISKKMESLNVSNAAAIALYAYNASLKD